MAEFKKGPFEPTPPEEAESGANLQDSALKRFGRRLSAHAICLFAGGVIGHITTSDPVLYLSANVIGFAAYVGLICLWARPREGYKSVFWKGPFICGIVQLIAALVLQLPWQFAFFAGGAQSWLQRLLGYGRRFGSEWATLFWLLAGANVWAGFAHESSIHWSGLLSIPLIAAAGYIGQKLYRKLCFKSMRNSGVERLQKELRLIKISSFLNEPLKKEINRLCEYLDSYRVHYEAGDSESEWIIGQARTALKELSRLDSQKRSGDAAGIFSFVKNQRGSAQDPDLYADSLRLRLIELNAMISELVRNDTRKSRSAADEVYDSLNLQAQTLVRKSLKLPYEIQDYVNSIASSAGEMLQLLQENPQNASSCKRFLTRYLKAVDEILDEYSKLHKRQDLARDEIKKAFDKVEALLKRLAQAFADELNFMVKNDAEKFNAELNALDKFLKMHGH